MAQELLGKTECIEVQHDEIRQKRMAQVLLCLNVLPNDENKFEEKLKEQLKDIEGFRSIIVENTGGICRYQVKVNVDYVKYPDRINLDVKNATIHDINDAKRAIICEKIPKIENCCKDVLKKVGFN